ncbi:MAG: cyclic nucleotide-binding domain-containing protein [Nannocystaceae bacterium]|nr:cyclic nucleotide-binding domain-containing protein [Myxococcales bacterium]
MLSIVRTKLRGLLFDELICRRYRARLATTAREREAIYRLRYRVYAQEQSNLDHPEVDMKRRRVCSEIDEDPATRIYYLGDPGRPLGTVRLRVWGPGEAPAEVVRFHSLDLLPEVDRLTVGDIKMVMIEPRLRGTNAAGAMLVNALVAAMRERPVDVWFAISAPGLLRRYHMLGFDAHGGRLVGGTRGLEVSILGLAGDLAEIERRGSPIVRAMRRAGVPQGGPWIATIRAHMAADRKVVRDPSKVRAAIERLALVPGSVVQGMSRPALRQLAREGVLLELDAGDKLLHEGFVAKDLYVVVDGRVQFTREGGLLGEGGAGCCAGETALLETRGRHGSTCAATTPARVVVLRPRRIRALARRSRSEYAAELRRFRARLRSARAERERVRPSAA